MTLRSRSSRARSRDSWILAVLLLTGPVWAGPGALSSGPTHPVVPTSPPAPLAAAPFAERAGYSSERLASVVGVRPAAAVLHVDVVFQLRSSGPGAPDASGAAVLTPAEFVAEYSPTGATVRAAEAYFLGFGLRTVSVSPDRLVLSLSGPAPDFGRAFGTSLVAGRYGGAPVMLPSAPPRLPASLQASVAAVVGLTSGFDPFSFSLLNRPAPPRGGGSPSFAPGGEVTPATARSIYDFSGLYNLSGGAPYATGHAIAAVLWGEGYAPSDLAAFFSSYYPSPPFPAPNVTAFPLDGAPAPAESALSSPDPKAVEEMTLDVEWAASMAPGASILAVYTIDGPAPQYGPSVANLTDALEKAISLRNSTNLTAISMSFGVPEASDPSLASAWAPLFDEATRLGISLLAATGDTGGDTTDAPSCSGTPAPEYPSSSPAVISVGGTTVALGVSGFNESAWPGSGGGYSGEFSAPSWQLQGSAAQPIEANGLRRGLPDVSASAADNLVYYDGQAQAAAGTSFATPLWAALVADIDAKWGHPLGFFTDRLYHVGASEERGAIQAGLADVVGGQNCVAAANPGWDAVTGWGSPRALLLYYDLVGSFVDLSLHVSSPTVSPGGSLTIRVQLSNLTTGLPIAGTNVEISLVADVPFGPCTGRFGGANPATNQTGGASATLGVPLCYLGSHADVTAVVSSATYYGNNSTKVTVNLLGWFPQLKFLDAPPWNYLTFTVILAGAIAAGVVFGRRRGPARPPGPAATAPSATAGSAPGAEVVGGSSSAPAVGPPSEPGSGAGTGSSPPGAQE